MAYWNIFKWLINCTTSFKKKPLLIKKTFPKPRFEPLNGWHNEGDFHPGGGGSRDRTHERIKTTVLEMYP